MSTGGWESSWGLGPEPIDDHDTTEELERGEAEEGQAGLEHKEDPGTN